MFLTQRRDHESAKFAIVKDKLLISIKLIIYP